MQIQQGSDCGARRLKAGSKSSGDRLDSEECREPKCVRGCALLSIISATDLSFCLAGCSVKARQVPKPAKQKDKSVADTNDLNKTDGHSSGTWRTLSRPSASSGTALLTPSIACGRGSWWEAASPFCRRMRTSRSLSQIACWCLAASPLACSLAMRALICCSVAASDACISAYACSTGPGAEPATWEPACLANPRCPLLLQLLRMSLCLVPAHRSECVTDIQFLHDTHGNDVAQFMPNAPQTL